ncbi:MAG: prephenate dehydrogenase, partial [Planctomycetota bacterium]
MKAPWPTVAIIGVGLIGGSIGAALLTRKLARRVIGIGRTKTSLREASRRKLVSETSLDIMSSVSEADLVIVATSLSTISATLEAIDAFVR